MDRSDGETVLVSISITGPDADWLAGYARELVDRRLVACANISPAVRSIYQWDGTVEDDAEAAAVLHTVADRVEEIIERTNVAHPYDTVQILATEVVAADPAYRRWVIDTVQPAELR